MDIVEELRIMAAYYPTQGIAADEIERLRLANSDLHMWYDYARTECDKMREELKELRLSYEVVVAALKEKE